MKEKINNKIDKLFDMPFLAIPVSIFAFYIPWYLVGSLGTTTVSKYVLRLITGVVLTCLVYWLRGDRMYSCGIKKRGIKGFKTIIPIAVLFVVVMLFKIIKFSGISIGDFLSTLVLATEAGFCEEMMVRGIPLGNTLWRRDSIKSIIGLSVYSSIIFGLLHLGNVALTGDIALTGIQAYVDIFAGLFFVAVYLRSGSIIPGIVVHALWDFMLMYNPSGDAVGGISLAPDKAEAIASITLNSGLSEDVAQVVFVVVTALFATVVAVMWLTITLILIRKSKRDEIMENFTRE